MLWFMCRIHGCSNYNEDRLFLFSIVTHVIRMNNELVTFAFDIGALDGCFTTEQGIGFVGPRRNACCIVDIA